VVLFHLTSKPFNHLLLAKRHNSFILVPAITIARSSASVPKGNRHQACEKRIDRATSNNT
jgi:hypothetical protein